MVALSTLTHRGGLHFFFTTSLERRNHLLLHYVYVGLLFSQALMGDLDVALEELELLEVQVAVLSLF